MSNEPNKPIPAQELSEEELGGIVGGASVVWGATGCSAGCGGDGVGGGAGLASAYCIFSACNGDNCIDSAALHQLQHQ